MSEPLILLPGFLTDARVWGPQIEALSVDTSLMLPALTGVDTIEDMAQHVLETAPPTFALAGLSLGAVVAMEVLRCAPDRVRRVALISATCLAETPPAAAERETRIARAKGGRLYEVVGEEVPPEALAPGPLQAPVAEFMAEMAMAMGTHVYLRQSRAMQRRPDQQRNLRHVRVPSLVICGRHDSLVLPRRHEFMAGLIPRAELVQIEEAGHVPTLETPDRVTDALRNWMSWQPAAQLLR